MSGKIEKSRGKRFWFSTSLFGACAALLLTFQNCSQPLPGGSSSLNSKLSAEMDFSYDAKLDQIAYMSCPAIKGNYDKDLFFTLRAGAYRTGGLRLKNEFFQTYEKKTVERKIDLLTHSKANAATALQLAIRQVGTLDSTVTVSGTPKKGIDYTNLLIELGTSEMNTHLVNMGLDVEKNQITGQRVRYMRLGTNQGAHMEGTLHFGETEALASDLRDGFLSTGRAVLAMTYVHPSESGNRDTDVRTPNRIWPGSGKDDGGIAYGMGYQLTFERPPGAKGLMEKDNLGNPVTPAKELAAYPSNLMTQVVERDLMGTGERVPWTCPSALRFKIVRPEDLSEGNCRRLPDPDPEKMNTDAYKELKIARNSLRYEDWYIDWDRKCIIPKKGGSSCYGELNYVQYDITAAAGCDKHSTTSSNSLKSKVCVAWASVCYRNN